MATDNFRKHTSKNPLQRFLIGRFSSALLEELQDLHPDSILDVGCGEGFMLEKVRVAGIARALEGVDVRSDAVEIGRALHPELTLRQGSIYALPYPDASFDVVVCSEVLEHLERPEEALTELIRVAKRYCVISVPNEPFFQTANFLRGKNLSRWGNDIEHIQHWTKMGITSLLEKYCRVRRVRNPFPWTLVVGEK